MIDLYKSKYQKSIKGKVVQKRYRESKIGKIARKKWLEDNKEKVRKYKSEWNKKHNYHKSEYFKNYAMKYRKDPKKKKERRRRDLYVYGLTYEEYEKLLEEQNNTCKICKGVSHNGKSLCVDHDHISGKVRGLLCDKCNRGLGCYNDDISLLLEAINYLSKNI